MSWSRRGIRCTHLHSGGGERGLFTIKLPSEEQISSILDRHSGTPFSYSQVGRSRHEPLPDGYNVDRNAIQLGSGESAFVAAKVALRRWEMFDLGWLRVQPTEEIRQGALVAVVVSHFHFHSVNLSRIVYVEESDDAAPFFRFAYGTTREHAEMGEERFTISWNRSNDSVTYEILAFSRPRAALARIGYPLSRGLQKRFARASLAAMARAVSAA